MGANLWPVDAVSGAPSWTGRVLRQVVGAVWAGKTAARPLGARTGVVAGTPTNIATTTSSTWTVTPHQGVLDLEATAVAGPYVYSFNTNQTGSVNAAHATLERIDILSVQMSDPAEADGSSNPGVAIVYTAGTAAAAGTQVQPATPARAFVLATIAVPHSGSGSPAVTFVAPFVTAAGGITPAQGSTYYPASPYLGQYIDDAVLGLMRYNGTAWEPDRTGRMLWATRGTGTTRLGTSANPQSPAQDCGATITLATTRRLRIYVKDSVLSASGAMAARLWPAYISGSSVPAVAASTGATLLNDPADIRIEVTNGKITHTAESDVLLAAGTWTFFPLVQRVAGGAGTDSDVHGPSYCAVYDAGPS